MILQFRKKFLGSSNRSLKNIAFRRIQRTVSLIFLHISSTITACSSSPISSSSYIRFNLLTEFDVFGFLERLPCEKWEIRCPSIVPLIASIGSNELWICNRTRKYMIDGMVKSYMLVNCLNGAGFYFKINNFMSTHT